jgi:nicotinate (nicotinamide) nucleotide adenylyltransferase
MEFFLRAPSARTSAGSGRIGVFPGTFNPFTNAHLALAEAALRHVDEIVFVLPKSLPHKEFEGASFAGRAEMLAEVAGANPRFSAAATEGGLFLEMAQEFRAVLGEIAGLSFLCGRDAAERIIEWDYGHAGKLGSFFQENRLLVAARSGEFEPPPQFAQAIERLNLEQDWSHVSATEIRRRITAGLPWKHLAPQAIRARIERIYGPTSAAR